MRDGAGGDLMRAVSRFALVSMIGGLAAACSADSGRFSDNPFSNPFATADNSAPASKSETPPADRVGAMPRGSVSAAPLAPVGSTGAPRGARSAAAGGWTAKGGTPITVATGDTLAQIANRYGVPSSAILSANGLSAREVTPGRQITIPVYTTASVRPAPVETVEASAPRVVATAKLPAPAPKPASVADASRHIRPTAPFRVAAAPAAPARSRVEPAETGSVPAKVRTRPGRKGAEETADAKGVASRPPEPVRTARAEPAPKVGAVVKSEPLPARKEKVAVATPAKVEPKPARAEAGPKVAKAEIAPPVAKRTAEPQKIASIAPAKVAPEPAKPAKEVEATGALPAATSPSAPAGSAAEFRWPARGRVISGFGGGGSNEGINIAVPDGTPVKAAESGTVAYAGSEVKGYGNLVLIRHENGYVSAYAHNGDIEVKRGQKVARGQVIAKSGQSGNVTSPQLHFELRKGSTPVDPTPLLASN